MEMTINNLCNSCTNIGCEFQSGIVRTKCAFYEPPHIETDNCGNYVIQEPTTKNDLADDKTFYEQIVEYCNEHFLVLVEKDVWEDAKKALTTKNDLPHCQCTDAEIAKSFIEDVEAVKDQLPCGEQMDFPNTFDEFAKDYGFKDKDEVYTNGTELIPVFRVKQWLEHISTTKNDLSSGLEKNSKKLEKDFGESDCISREDALMCLTGMFENREYEPSELIKIFARRIKTLSPVTPQEPRTGHWVIRPHVYGVTYCSECDFELKIDDTNYCPNCGAKMIESQESEET